MKCPYQICVLFYIVCIVYCVPVPDLPCAKCTDVTCTVRQDCELDTIPCGCCPSCVRKIGQVCEAFSPGCETGADCITPGGIFDRRPPYYQPYLKGVCIQSVHPETRPVSNVLTTKSAAVV